MIKIKIQSKKSTLLPSLFYAKIIIKSLNSYSFSFINMSMTIAQILGMGIVSFLASTTLGLRGVLIINGIFTILSSIFFFTWLNRKKLEELIDVQRAKIIADEEILTSRI